MPMVIFWSGPTFREFDLIFVLRDTPVPGQDEKLATHILDVHRKRAYVEAPPIQFDLLKNTPEPVGVLRIVRGILMILIERDRVLHLNRHRPYLHLYTKVAELTENLAVEIRLLGADPFDGPRRALLHGASWWPSGRPSR